MKEQKIGFKAEPLCLAPCLLTSCLVGFCVQVCEILDCSGSLAEWSGFVSQLHKTSEC